MRVSVILCTHNRGRKLGETLESLESQRVGSGIDWEVIVVDNNSSDETCLVVEKYIARVPNRFRYIFEKQQGKSRALNTGIRSAKGEILVMTDDDCIADPRWIQAIVEEFSCDPKLHVLGGRVELYDATDQPVTIRPFRERIPFSSAGQLFYLIPGCNLAVRREVFDAVGDFDVLLGPGSKRSLVTEDTDFLYRAFRKGFGMTYSPTPLIYHNHGRKTIQEVEALKFTYAKGRGAFYCKHILRKDVTALKMAWWELSYTINALMRNAFSRDSIRPQYQAIRGLILGALLRLLGEVSPRT